MRTMTIVGVVLVMYFPILALGIPTIPDMDSYALRMECSVHSQAEMQDCLAEKAKSSLELLKDIENEVLGILSSWDEDSKYVRQSRASLIRSNKNFVTYREAQCDYSASLSGGGVGGSHEMRRLACIAELNYRRAKQLHDEASALPLK